MEVRAKLRYLKIAPRKVRLVIDLIRGLPLAEARNQLKFVHKRAAKPILKLLESAVANAKNNFNLDENNLYIKKITADEGPKLKRWRPRAYGRATQILKRSTHVTIILDEMEKKEEQKETKKERPKQNKSIKEKDKSNNLKKGKNNGSESKS